MRMLLDDGIRPGSQYCPPLLVLPLDPEVKDLGQAAAHAETWPHCGGKNLAVVADDRPLGEILIFRGRRYSICLDCNPDFLFDVEEVA